jgi:threonine/homoserine/homoserine lactone efflux protein
VPDVEADPRLRVTAALVAGALAGYGVAIPVGAIGAYLVALSARTSFRLGVCAALGVATADGVYALLATLGGTALGRALQPVMTPLRWISAFVLLLLAARGTVGAIRQFRSHRAGRVAREDVPSGPLRAYLGLWGVTMLNPMTVVYFAALVLGGQAAAAPRPLDRGVFVVAAFVASASWQVFLAGSGALLGRVLTGPRGRCGTALASSLLIAVLAVRIMG